MFRIDHCCDEAKVDRFLRWNVEASNISVIQQLDCDSPKNPCFIDERKRRKV